MNEATAPIAATYPAKTIDDLKQTTLVSFIDMSRWMAALMVTVGHIRDPLLLGYGQLSATDRTIPVKIWYFVSGYHAEAVLVFFVISGYLVGGLTSARASLGKLHLGGYLVDRWARLFVAFIPALLLGALLDWSGSHWFAASGLYDGAHPMIVQKIHGIHFIDNATLKVFLINLFMLQYYFGPEFGTNDPLWTLSTEFWFYMVFAAGLAGYLMKARSRWIAAAIALMMCALLGVEFVQLFGLWLIGLAIAAFDAPKMSRPVTATVALAAFLVFLRLNDAWFDLHPEGKMLAHYVMALLFGWLIMSMRHRSVTVFERFSRFNRFMADFSFSLYLIHFPLMMFLIAMLGYVTHNPGFFNGFHPTSAVGVLSYIGIIVTCLISAYAFSRLTEANTWRVRQFAKTHLGRLFPAQF